MTQYIEYKNEREETGRFLTQDEVIQSAIGWLESYEDIDNMQYQEEISTLESMKNESQSDDIINKVNNITSFISYSYVACNK